MSASPETQFGEVSTQEMLGAETVEIVPPGESHLQGELTARDAYYLLSGVCERDIPRGGDSPDLVPGLDQLRAAKESFLQKYVDERQDFVFAGEDAEAFQGACDIVAELSPEEYDLQLINEARAAKGLDLHPVPSPELTPWLSETAESAKKSELLKNSTKELIAARSLQEGEAARIANDRDIDTEALRELWPSSDTALEAMVPVRHGMEEPSVYSEWAKENRTEEAEQKRREAAKRLGPLTAQQRAELTMMARGEIEPAVAEYEPVRVGGKAVEAVVERVKPRIINTADRLRNPDKDGAVVPVMSTGEMRVIIDAVKKEHGLKHPLVKENPLLGRDSPRNLRAKLQKLQEDPEYVAELHGKDANIAVAALEPLAEDIKVAQEKGERIEASDTDRYIASQLVARYEEHSAASDKKKPGRKRSRLNLLHS